MRHQTMTGLLLALAIALLAGCGGGEAPVIPTVAELPTVTPTEEVFVTPTPADEVPPTEIAPTVAPDLPTPTPIAGGTGDTVEGPCSPANLDVILAGLDNAALRADLDSFSTALRAAAVTVGEWTLTDVPDPFAGTTEDTLPIARLTYARGGTQQAAILVIPAPDTVRALYNDCLTEQSFFREGDISASATVTVEPLAIGDLGVVATIVEPVDAEASDTGVSEWVTDVYVVLSGDKLYQFINIPAFDAAMGLEPINRADAVDLLSGIVEFGRGL